MTLATAQSGLTRRRLLMLLPEPWRPVSYSPRRTPPLPVTAGSDEYLYFGYWLHKPDAPGGAHPFMTFAGGMQPFAVRGDNPASPRG